MGSMDGKQPYSVEHAIRSRPTLRFGRTYALCFSVDGKYVFCGDTVGSIWCINLESERIVGLFQNHSDIVNDIAPAPSGLSLFSVSLDKSIAMIVLPEECGGRKGARDSYNDNADEKQSEDSSANLIKDIKKSKGKKAKGRSSRRDRDSSSAKEKHMRSRSKSKAAKAKKESEHKQFSSMTLKELMDDAFNDEFKTYDGIKLYQDEKYGFSRVRISEDGNTLATATRKIMLFSVTSADSLSAGPKVMDSDNDHVKSLNFKDGLVLTSRSGCARSKMWSAADGKQFKVIKCKKAIAQSDFLCDNEWAVVLQQELVANEAPKAPSMRLYQYNKAEEDGAGPKLATSQSATSTQSVTYFDASAE